VDDAADTGDGGEADDDAHGRVVVGRAILEVGEGRPDGSGVAEAVDKGEGGGAFGWGTGDGVCDPGVGLMSCVRDRVTSTDDAEIDLRFRSWRR
jgi:hypothetical protein